MEDNSLYVFLFGFAFFEIACWAYFRKQLRLWEALKSPEHRRQVRAKVIKTINGHPSCFLKVAFTDMQGKACERQIALKKDVWSNYSEGSEIDLFYHHENSQIAATPDTLEQQLKNIQMICRMMPIGIVAMLAFAAMMATGLIPME